MTAQFTIVDFDALGDYLSERYVVDPESGCWLWQKGKDRDGYGVANWDGKTWRAHRLSYTHVHGAIADGMELDHRCEIHECVNPAHLDPVTNLENWIRGYLRRGMDRATAEKLALIDVERIRDEREQIQAAKQAAAACGVHVGIQATVRGGKTVWTVKAIHTDFRHPDDVGVFHEPWVKLANEVNGRTTTVPLGDVRLVADQP